MKGDLMFKTLSCHFLLQLVSLATAVTLLPFEGTVGAVGFVALSYGVDSAVGIPILRGMDTDMANSFIETAWHRIVIKND